MKYAILTFGCRTNQADSLDLADALLQRGAEPAAADAADLVVVNTCSVTAASEQGARQAIRRVARHNPVARIVVTGCYATRQPSDLARLPRVVRVVPNERNLRLAAWAVAGPHTPNPARLLQASDRMLALMRCPYTLDAYRRTVDYVRERLPHAAIAADVIVGFPGETDEDFAQSETYLRSSALTSLHVFRYSDRPGTLAAQMRDRVAGVVVRCRADRLRPIGAVRADRFRRSLVGQIRPGLTLGDGFLVVTDNHLAGC